MLINFFASSSAIYGNVTKELIEELIEDFEPLFPVSYYCAGKPASEAFVSA